MPEPAAEPVVRTGRRRRFIAAACAAMAVIVGSSLFYAQETVFAYSTVEIKTETASFQLKFNKKDQLIGVTTENIGDPELADILSDLQKKSPSLDDVVTALSGKLDSEAEVSVQSPDVDHAADLCAVVKEKVPAKPVTTDEKDTVLDKSGENGTASDRNDTAGGGKPDESKSYSGQRMKEKPLQDDSAPGPAAGGITAGIEGTAEAEHGFAEDGNNTGREPEGPEVSGQAGNGPEGPAAAKQDGRNSGDPDTAGKPGVEPEAPEKADPAETEDGAPAESKGNAGAAGRPESSQPDAGERDSGAQSAEEEYGSPDREQPPGTGDKASAGSGEPVMTGSEKAGGSGQQQIPENEKTAGPADTGRPPR